MVATATKACSQKQPNKVQQNIGELTSFSTDCQHLFATNEIIVRYEMCRNNKMQ